MYGFGEFVYVEMVNESVKAGSGGEVCVCVCVGVSIFAHPEM